MMELKECVARARVALYDVDEGLFAHANDGRVDEIRRRLAEAEASLCRIEAEISGNGLLELLVRGEVA